MKKPIASTVKDPENRSKKFCVCGNHSTKAKNAKRKNSRKAKAWFCLICGKNHFPLYECEDSKN